MGVLDTVKRYRANSVPLQPLAIDRIVLDNTVSPTPSYIPWPTRLVHCLRTWRKCQLGFLGIFFGCLKKTCQKICSLHTISQQKESWTSMNLLHCRVKVWWKWDGSRRNNHPCQRSMCLDKAPAIKKSFKRNYHLGGGGKMVRLRFSNINNNNNNNNKKKVKVKKIKWKKNEETCRPIQ